MPIKVLHIFGGGVRSGIETHILTLARGLEGSGIEFVLAPLNKGSFIAEARPYVNDIVISDKKFRGDLTFIGRLAERIRKAAPDVIHTHSYDGNFYGSLAARKAGVTNVVNTVHTFDVDAMIDMYFSRLVRRVVCRQNRMLLKSAKRLIAVCGPLKNKLAREGFEEDKIKVIPNGLDLEEYPLPYPDVGLTRKELGLSPDDLVVGTSGRIARVKNFDIFLRAAKIVLDRGVGAKFIVIGEGPLRGQMEKLAAELDIAEKVSFVGWQGDIGKFISVMDLFVLCSKTETTSYSLLEAMALGKPTVATAVGGNVELVRGGVTGLLVPERDDNSTAEAMVNLLTDKEKSARFGAAGRERLEKEYRAEMMVEKTFAVYKEIAKNGI